MFRFFRNLLLMFTFAAFTAASVLMWTSTDPLYTVQEWVNLGRFSAYDDIIREQSQKRGLDPLLVKAMVWRESAFDPNKVGTSRERGLMQVGEAAGQDWAKARKIETFLPTDLFDARTNIDAGTWYFRRALERWKEKDDPIPFALAEYNAGASRVDRWIAQSGLGAKVDAHDLLMAIDFPGTRRYVEEITARYRFYQARNGL
jgi:soluble lytic murein transglycosylase